MSVKVQIDESRIFSLKNQNFKKILFPDDKSVTGYGSIQVKSSDIEQQDGVYYVMLNPEAMYGINSRMKDENGTLAFSHRNVTGEELASYNENAVAKNGKGAAMPLGEDVKKESDAITPDAIYGPPISDKVKADSKKKPKADYTVKPSKGAAYGAAGAAAGFAAANAGKSIRKGTGEKTAKSIPKKIVTGAAIAGGVVAGGTVAMGTAAQKHARKAFSAPMAEGIAQLIMAPTSPLERRIPPVGVAADRSDRRDGYEFDV